MPGSGPRVGACSLPRRGRLRYFRAEPIAFAQTANTSRILGLRDLRDGSASGAPCPQTTSPRGYRDPLLHALPDKTSLRDLRRDRKSTRLNSSHANISYAVFCLI